MIHLLHRATQSGVAILSQCKQGDFAESHCTAKQRDASPACATVCVEKIISTARCLFRGATAEERGVMLGASLSPAAYDKIHRNAGKQDPVLLQVCPWCKSRLTQGWKKKEGTVGDWSWRCCMHRSRGIAREASGPAFVAQPRAGLGTQDG